MKSPLSSRLGRRIRSRLFEMCRAVEIFAPNDPKEIRAAGHYRS